MTTAYRLLSIILLINMTGCSSQPEKPQSLASAAADAPLPEKNKGNREGVRTIHIMVALCDNKYQGIVPVPKSIGNGQDPASNLYWGCDLGLKTYFKKKTSDWNLVLTQKTGRDTVMERLVFKHKKENVYMLADAYNGKYIKEATEDLLKGLSGELNSEIILEKDTLWFGSAASLVGYIGHDGLMDFGVSVPQNADTVKRAAIILACASKQFFSPLLKRTAANPILWTTNLMCPEAYTLHDALREWIQNKSPEEIRTAGALAYARYQKCSVKAARNLLVYGF